MMKSYLKYIYVLVAVFLCFSCEDSALENVGLDSLDNNSTGPYVALTSTASTVVEGESFEVKIEIPTPIETDVSVNFEISGTAELGTDYTIMAGDGVTLNGGSGIGSITYAGDEGGADGVSFTVTAPYDDLDDDDESIIITLTGATAATGDELVLGDPNAGSGDGPVSVLTVVVADPELEVGAPVKSYTIEESTKLDTLSIPLATIPGGSATLSYTLFSKNGVLVEGVDYDVLDGASPINNLKEDISFNIEFLPDGVIDSDTLVLIFNSIEGSTGLDLTISESNLADTVEIYVIDDLSTVEFDTDSLILSSPEASVATTYLFDIKLSAPVSANVVLDYSLSDAISGITLADGGTLTIESGDVSGSAVVSIDPSVFDGEMDLSTSIVIDDLTSTSNEVSLTETLSDLSRSITIDNTP